VKKVPKGKPFPKGASPNPGGVSKEKRELMERLKGDADEVHDALMALVRTGNVQAVIYAHQHLVGKPKERIELSGEDGGPVRVAMSNEQLLHFLEKLDKETHEADPEAGNSGRSKVVATDDEEG
jgi:hypothetical protein